MWNLLFHGHGPSLSKAVPLRSHAGHSILLSERLSNPSNASAGLSKATLAATRPSHLFLRAFKPAVCPASNASNAPARLSKATLADTRRSHLFLRAFKPAVCPASNASNAPAGLPQAFPRQLSQLHAPAICF